VKTPTLSTKLPAYKTCLLLFVLLSALLINPTLICWILIERFGKPEDSSRKVFKRCNLRGQKLWVRRMRP
jgi:hypothetical protein